ncbi:hypothetical protein BDV26DRAFT_305685 [Aspergillus bertholletiae]|uniref:Uncharacterized protein n=1 Tax=Aspergillus bertholletiae TaxID=1226010 RepID=A0A5N7B2Q3_9EURO|nr:hypothetical protein BDV26DRAFT_305685 [Aspergillus bertholletiae]
MTFRPAEQATPVIKSESVTADDRLHGSAPGKPWGIRPPDRTSESDKLYQMIDQEEDGGGWSAEDMKGEGLGQADEENEEVKEEDDDDDDDYGDSCWGQDAHYDHPWGESSETDMGDGGSGSGHGWTAGEEELSAMERVRDDSGLGHGVALMETNHYDDELRDKVRFLQAQVTDLLYEKNQLAAKVKKLEGKGDNNSNSSRNCFLTRYKWQKLHCSLTLDEWEHLVHANIDVSGGDALADSELYISGDWKDYGVFVDLYGIDPHAAWSVLKNGLTIKLVNAQATILASKNKTCTPNFRELFAHFMKSLQRTGYPTNYRFGYTEDLEILELRSSFLAFRHALKAEVVDTAKTEVMKGKHAVW